MWSHNVELFLMEERQRRFEDEIRREALRREAAAARVHQPGMVRRGAHYLGVGLVRVGERLQIHCREAMAQGSASQQVEVGQAR